MLRDNDLSLDLLRMRFGADALLLAKRSYTLRTPRGSPHRGDMLMWETSGVRHLGIADFFYCVPSSGCFAVALKCVPRGSAWSRSNEKVLVDARDVSSPLSYFLHTGGEMAPRFASSP